MKTNKFSIIMIKIMEPGRCDDDALWSNSCISVSLDHAVDDWEQECRGFTRSGLRELCFFHNTLKSD